MNLKISILILGVLMMSCHSNSKPPALENKEETSIAKKEQGYYNSDHLIEVEELKQLQFEHGFKLIDFRKLEAFSAGHIPQAIQLWRSDIEDKTYPYEGMMASKESMNTLFSRLGIAQNDTLILYDNNGACDSARLWWILKSYGFENVKLLNGGLDQWVRENGNLSMDIQTYPESNFIFPKNSAMKLHIGLEEMKALVKSNQEIKILDTRTTSEYTGERQKQGAKRAGHIPNSKSVDWAHAIDYNNSKRFKSHSELLELYAPIIKVDDHIIAYCHSGVRSAHTTFVLTELLGFKNVRNYDGSWVEWSYFEELPIESEDTTKLFK